jgi:Sugar (pentulose and hexulose) kinases
VARELLGARGVGRPLRVSGERLLAIDHGTQSVRALLFDLSGNLLARSRVPIEPYVPGPPGFAEQDPELYWRSVCAATRGLLAQPDVSAGSIAGLAVTTQRATMVATDAQGRPLRPAIVWLDQRRTDGVPPVRGLWGAAFRLSGMSGTVAYFQAEAEAHWLARHEPETWRKTERYLFLSGFLAHRLTGRFVDSPGGRSATSRSTTGGSAGRRASTGSGSAAGPPGAAAGARPPGGRLGELSAAAAEATGLPKGSR